MRVLLGLIGLGMLVLLSGCGHDYCIAGIGPCRAFQNMSNSPGTVDSRTRFRNGLTVALQNVSADLANPFVLVATGGTVSGAAGSMTNYRFLFRTAAAGAPAGPWRQAQTIDGAELQAPWLNNAAQAYFRPATFRGQSITIKVLDGTMPNQNDQCDTCTRTFVIP